MKNGPSNRSSEHRNGRRARCRRHSHLLYRGSKLQGNRATEEEHRSKRILRWRRSKKAVEHKIWPGKERSKFLRVAQCCGAIWPFLFLLVVSFCLRMEVAAVGIVRETAMSHKCCSGPAWQHS